MFTVFVFVAASILAFPCEASLSKPSWNTISSNYPSYDAYDSHTGLQDLAGLRSWLYRTNTCAMRLSYALIKSGSPIDVTQGQCSIFANVKNNLRQKYIIRVATYKCYLKREWGNPDLTGSTSGTFANQKGIIMFENCGWTDATGHVDLWDGSNCVGKCPGYFNECSSISLWRLA